MESETVHLRIECEKCPGAVLERDTSVWLVGALAVAFHSSHEGHLMKVWIDGELQLPSQDRPPNGSG